MVEGLVSPKPEEHWLEAWAGAGAAGWRENISYLRGTSGFSSRPFT